MPHLTEAIPPPSEPFDKPCQTNLAADVGSGFHPAAGFPAGVLPSADVENATGAIVQVPASPRPFRELL